MRLPDFSAYVIKFWMRPIWWKGEPLMGDTGPRVLATMFRKAAAIGGGDRKSKRYMGGRCCLYCAWYNMIRRHHFAYLHI